MEKYAILLGYYEKQQKLIQKLYSEISTVDLSVYEKRYFFALKTQQFYTVIEDLLKQIAKSFENHVEDLAAYHKGLLLRLATDIPQIRPAVIHESSFVFLDKLRSFRHFVRHAYDCELDEMELSRIQKLIVEQYEGFQGDLKSFRGYVEELL